MIGFTKHLSLERWLYLFYFVLYTILYRSSYLGVGGAMSKTRIPVHRGVPVTKMIMILRTSLLKRFYNLDISWFSLFYLVTMNSRNKIKLLTVKNLIFKIIVFLIVLMYFVLAVLFTVVYCLPILCILLSAFLITILSCP